MGKSVIATLLGRLIAEGSYTLDQAAPIPEWQTPGDARQAIRIRDILNMASGLRIRAEQDPDYADDGRYPDHWYYYTGDNAFAYAASRQPQWPAGTIGRYRNTDPVLGSYLVRLAVEMVDPGLPEGVISVGVRSEILQQAPALLGNEVIFHLSLDRVEGNRLGFSLRVSDRHGTIATGNHERAVVSAALLAERAEKRTKEVL